MLHYSRLLSCILLVCAGWVNAAHAQARLNVVLLMSEELDGKGAVIPLSGEVVELLRYLEQHTRLKFEVRRYPWKRAVENAALGEGLIFGISKTRERLRSFKFSMPIFTDQALLVTLCRAKFNFNAINDLKGKTIGIVRGTSYGEEFDRLSNVLFKVEDDTSNNLGRFKKLSMRRMDAFLLYSSSANIGRLETYFNQQYMAEFGDKQADSKLFCILPKPVSSIDIHIAMRPDGDASLLQKIDKAILQGHQDGKLARIYSPR
ncbi:MAG: transporter substrate-binding domain-containing protein [Burkholderiales bacterium]|nr:transporter substrate-binding domain-containing protein [Burkholderiales bacterium]MBI3730608.1 transporter substrate-binding domain-containing protein [Burkholderiales bacterium]